MDGVADMGRAIDRIDATVGDLVERCIGHDVAALGQLYDLYHGVLRAFARRLLADTQAAEDLVHDVFVDLPKTLRRFEGRSSLRTFLLAVAANHARHGHRASSRRRRLLDRVEEHGSHGPSPRPDEEGERRQLAARLEQALAQLPIEQRLVVVLCSVEERTSTEAAEILNIPEATVRTRLFHARKKLREHLQDLGVSAGGAS